MVGETTLLASTPQAPSPTIDAGWAMRTADYFRHKGAEAGAEFWKNGLEIIHSQAACVLANIANGYTEFGRGNLPKDTQGGEG